LVADLGDEPASPEQRLDVALLARDFHLTIQPRSHTGKAAEVVVDERLRLVLGDAELVGEREGPLSVDGAEVDGLGTGAHLAGHVVDADAEDDRRGLAMDVAATPERGYER